MSARRTLVSRQQRDAPSSPVQRSGRQSEVAPRQPTALPPYQPPSCPLTETARRNLANISANHDYKKYDKHIKAAIQNITSCVAESNDRWYGSKERVDRMAEKRLEAGEDKEKSEAEVRAEQRAEDMEKKVDRVTADSEKALRDLID
jgi:hypothetical protein